jgi:hypothetical protein
MKTLPSITKLSALVRHVKKYIGDEYRASEEENIPGIQLTVACDDKGNWDYQTGDNSYSGAAYHYPHWAVVGVYRRSNSKEVARDIQDQLADLLASYTGSSREAASQVLAS